MANSVLTNLQKALSSIGIDLALTGRYGTEKASVLGGYLVLSIVTIAYAFSSSAPLANAIGAQIQPQTISTTGEQWFVIRNQSEEDWTNITLILNDHYVHKGPETIIHGETARIFVKDFDYMLYVPRAQHFGTLEDTSESPPGPKAIRDMKPLKLIIQTDQGLHSESFGAKPPPEPAAKEKKKE